MDTGSYTMKALRTKYEDFASPAFVIKMGSKTLDSTVCPIQDLEVELCADGSAGGCKFTIGSEYDYEKSQWAGDLAKSIEVGAALEIQGGYVKKESIFYGYVDEYTVEYSGSEPPRITVVGVDGFGFLMNCQEPVYAGQKKPRQIIEEILSKATSAGFAKSVKVGAVDAVEVPPIKEQLDDFTYLKMLAERYCMSLLCVNGELIFDNVTGSTSPMLTLSAVTDLHSFQKRMSLKGQVGQVTVWGRDVNQKFIRGTADKVSIGGSGKSVTQLAPKFAKAVRREYSEYVRTEQECTKLAQARLDSLALELVSGEGSCLGIPELIPGRYIRIEGLDGEAEGSFFMSKVRHRFDRDGYTTSFEIKGARG